jgi:hypothetical protein
MTMSDTLTANPVVRILRRAIVVLDRDGWSPNGWDGIGKCRCMVNALSRASTELGLDGHGVEAVEAIAEHLALAPVDPNHVWSTVGRWNDAPGRTFTEVTDALEASATGREAEAVAR